MGIVAEGAASKHHGFMHRRVLEKFRFMTALLKTEKESFPFKASVTIYGMARFALFFAQRLMFYGTFRSQGRECFPSTRLPRQLQVGMTGGA